MSRALFSVCGNSQKLDGGSMFGNAPRALWQRWAPPDEENRIDLACRCLVVREDDRVLLFATAAGKNQTFRYAIRAVQAGQFALPPVEASSMYDADFHSRHGMGQVKVQP